MTIGERIAKYRKEIGATQDELGAVLGVSNQAVSKWETDVSLPDVLLLPKLADALGVTLDDLFGVERKVPEIGKCTDPDKFPAALYDEMMKFFSRSTKRKFVGFGETDETKLACVAEHVERGDFLLCISNIAGAAAMNKSFTFVDRDFKEIDGGKIFASDVIGKRLRYLSDKNVRKVVEYEYETALSRSKSFMERDEDRAFSLEEIAEGCGLSHDDADAALEKVVLLGINDTGAGMYHLRVGMALYAYAVFKVAEMMSEDMCYLMFRDTSTLSDIAF